MSWLCRYPVPGNIFTFSKPLDPDSEYKSGFRRPLNPDPKHWRKPRKKSQAKHFKNLGRFQDPYPRIFMDPDTFHYLRLTDSSSSSSSRLLLPAASTTRDRSPLLPSLRGILLSERNLLTDFICKKKNYQMQSSTRATVLMFYLVKYGTRCFHNNKSTILFG